MREALEQLNQAEQDWLAELKQRKAAGEIIVGTFCLYTPPELIAACGAIPIRLAMCGSHVAEREAEHLMRADTCAYCKAGVGARAAGDPWSDVVTHIVQATTCDEMRRGSQVWETELGIPYLRFSFPRTWQGDAPLLLFRNEMQWVADEIAKLTGRTLTGDALIHQIELWNEVRSLLTRIQEIRRRGGIGARDFFMLVSYSFTLPPDRLVPILQKGIDRLSTEPAQDRRPRIMLMGSAIARDDYLLLDLLDEAGVAVVADRICTGTRSFDLQVPTADPLASLAHDYLMHSFCAFRRPNTPMLDEAIAERDRSQIDGVIVKTLQFCDSWGHEVERIRRALDRPLLHIQSNYSPSEAGAMRTRVQAFIEMLRGG